MLIKIASWNINSVRARLDQVARFVAAESPDVLCLQEIKVADDQFPLKFFRELGYEHHVLYGQKAYHGVAIFSQPHVPLDKPTRRDWCDIAQGRHVHCRLPGGVELHNFYVPAGGDEPDREKNPKFAHKLDFMTEVAAWFKRRKRRTNRFILLGDLNVAPHENDVWNHKQLLRVVSHTPIEVEHMARWYQSHDWIDAVRLYTPTTERLYSWWSYRSPDWAKANKGRRLDHIWVTPALKDAVRSSGVVTEPRGYTKPSDHAPVVAEIEI